MKLPNIRVDDENQIRFIIKILYLSADHRSLYPQATVAWVNTT